MICPLIQSGIYLRHTCISLLFDYCNYELINCNINSIFLFTKNIDIKHMLRRLTCRQASHQIWLELLNMIFLVINHDLVKKISDFFLALTFEHFLYLYLRNKESFFVYYEVIVSVGSWSNAIKHEGLYDIFVHAPSEIIT